MGGWGGGGGWISFHLSFWQLTLELHGLGSTSHPPLLPSSLSLPSCTRLLVCCLPCHSPPLTPRALLCLLIFCSFRPPFLSSPYMGVLSDGCSVYVQCYGSAVFLIKRWMNGSLKKNDELMNNVWNVQKQKLWCKVSIFCDILLLG